MTLIERLEKFRKKEKMTVAELSRRLHVPGNYWYRWMKAKKGISGAYKRIVTDYLDRQTKRYTFKP